MNRTVFKTVVIFVFIIFLTGSVWADNSKFYGIYTFRGTECEHGTSTSIITIGGDISQRDTTYFYYYLPADTTTYSYSQVFDSEDNVFRRFTVEGNLLHIIEYQNDINPTTENCASDIILSFSNDYSSFTVSGTYTRDAVYDQDCSGDYTGSGTRIGSDSQNPVPKTTNITAAINLLLCSTNCGAYVAPGVWKEFDCYNLAAIGKTTGDDPFNPSWRLIGGYWQWGRKGPDESQWYDTNTSNFAHGPTGSDEDDANDAEIDGWGTSYAANGAWSDAEKTSNDPCPSGYRIPTEAQWDGIAENNTQSAVGTWSTDATNYSSGRFFGDNLMLPAAGFRHYSSGSLAARGTNGFYWASTENTYDSSLAWGMAVRSDGYYVGFAYPRETGHSVRCIANSSNASEDSTWSYRLSNNWTNCEGDSPDPETSGTATISQNGNNTTFVVGGRTYSGTVSNKILTYQYSISEDGGTTTGTITISLDSSTQSGSGQDAWSWTDGSYTCNGGGNISIQFVSGDFSWP